MWHGDVAGGYWVTIALWLTGFFFIYFIVLNGLYIAFILSGIANLKRYAHDVGVTGYYALFKSHLIRPISIIVPAYNEERNILETVQSLLLLHYPQFEVVVVDDGSTDKTLARLIERYDMVQRDKVYRRQLDCEEVHAVYESRLYPKLVVVTKDNGGKSDALNCGINVSSYPYYCTLDADTVLEEDALLKMIRPFLEDPEGMVAVGGVVRVGNNCVVERGKVVDIRIPRSLVELVQVVEYLQAFLSSRIAFSSVNSILLISGAFGMYRKSTVIEAGGYRTDTIGEDMELIVRIHRLMKRDKRPCRMRFLPDPVCWTEVPSDWYSLSRQRSRWQKGLIDSIRFNSEMLFNPRYGHLGLAIMPYYLFFELLGPIIELLGYTSMIVFWAVGVLSWQWALIFFLLAIGVGILISTGAILLEELSFHRYPRPLHLLALLFGCVVYNIGFRQINAVWRLIATLEYMVGFRLWGRIRRIGFRTTDKKGTNEVAS